jgi:hypothetical protein
LVAGGSANGGGGGGGLRYIFTSSKMGASLSGIVVAFVVDGQHSFHPTPDEQLAVWSAVSKPVGQEQSVVSVRNQKQLPGVQHSEPATSVEKVRLKPGAHERSIHLL